MANLMNPQLGQLSDVLTLLVGPALSGECDVEPEDFLVVVAPLLRLEPVRAGEPHAQLARILVSARTVLEDAEAMNSQAGPDADLDLGIVLDQQTERVVQAMLRAMPV